MTTTYVAARDALVGHLNAGWLAGYPSVPIFYENTAQIDLDTVGNTFLAVAVDFHDAVQADMDLDPYPGEEVFGEVNLRLFAKGGMGTRNTLAMFDFLTALMRQKRLSGVTTLSPAPGRKQSRDGWVSFDLNVPFRFYSKY